MGQAAAKMAYAANGGKVKGPGTETSDSVPVRLSKDEVVLPADTVKAVGLPALKALIAATHKHVKPSGNKRVRKMANGGLVGGDDANQPLPTYPSQQAASDDIARMGAAARAASAPAAPIPNTQAMGAAAAPAAAAPTIPPAPGAPQPLPSGQMALAARGAQEAVDSSLASGDYGAAVGHAVRGGLGVAGGAVADLANMVSPAVKTVGRAAYVLATGNDVPASPAAARLATTPASAPLAQPAGTPAFKPAADSQQSNPDGSSTPIPTVNGASGVTVTGAPGVSKFAHGGRTLYTNVAGDNTQAAAAQPSAQNDGAAQNLSNTYTAVGRLAASPAAAAGGSYIPGVNAPLTQYEQETAARNAGVTSTLAGGGSRQDIAREQMATQRAVAQMAAQAGLQGHQIAAATSRYGTDVAAGTAAARLAQEQTEAQPKITLSQQAVQAGQRLQDLQRQYSAASDPVARRQLYEQIVAAQGHVRSLSERFTTVAQGSHIDPNTGAVVQEPHLLFDNQTGQWVQSPGQSGAASRMATQPMPASKDKLVAGMVYQTARGPAKWDGAQFTAQ